MSAVLRITLVACAALMAAFTVAGIRRSRLRIEDSLFWLGLSALVLALSLFPAIGFAASDAFGFMAPVNFVFAFFIAVLTVKCFTLTRRCSELDDKVKELAQSVAVERLEHHERASGGGRGADGGEG